MSFVTRKQSRNDSGKKKRKQNKSSNERKTAVKKQQNQKPDDKQPSISTFLSPASASSLSASKKQHRNEEERRMIPHYEQYQRNMLPNNHNNNNVDPSQLFNPDPSHMLLGTGIASNNVHNSNDRYLEERVFHDGVVFHPQEEIAFNEWILNEHSSCGIRGVGGTGGCISGGGNEQYDNE